MMVPRNTAARMPSGTAMTSEIKSEMAPSVNVTGIRVAISETTLSRK